MGHNLYILCIYRRRIGRYATPKAIKATTVYQVLFIYSAGAIATGKAL